MKNIIILPDGARISSGSDADRSIKSCTIIECVNSGTELTLGSACCFCLEAQILTKGVKLGLSAGDLIELCKADDQGNESKIGTFRLDTPAKKSDNIYKITAYDRIVDLDKDLSSWLKSLTGWPYRLSVFAEMVCNACGLLYIPADILNADFPVCEFYKAGVTGRQLMQWIGEIAGRFCRATEEGEITFGWYTSSGVTVRPTGDRYYYSNALTYDDYEVAPIDAVKLRLADSDNGALWPNGAAANPYVITGSAILLARVTDDLKPYLETIQGQLAALPAYKPCKVSLPAGMDIRAGQTVQVVDKHGNAFTTLVMTKTQAGQRDTLECTGSPRRDSSSAVNNKSAAQFGAEQEAYALNAAKQAVDNQSWESLFDKWTNGGNIQGIFAQDGVWIFNAAVGKISNLIAEMIAAGKLKSTDGLTVFDLDSGKIVCKSGDGRSVEIFGGNIRLFDANGNERIWLTQGEHNYVYLFDSSGKIEGGIGIGHGHFQIAAPDQDNGGQGTGYRTVWKTINGEKVLCAVTEDT